MRETIRLLRCVGSPFVSGTTPPSPDAVAPLYRRAKNNRMLLLYLSALHRAEMLGAYAREYAALYAESLGTYDAMSRLSAILHRAGIAHTLFKTIRPYRSTTVDLDVIILDPGQYRASIRTMHDAGYATLGDGPNSTTVQDPVIGIGIDLYHEVAVSHIIYLDKRKLRRHVVDNPLPNRKTARSLAPPADLLALIAHATVKEHMYTVSEYYSTVHFLAQMRADDVRDFIAITRDYGLVSSVQVHLGLTARLHRAAHGSIPDGLRRIVAALGVNPLELQRLHETPHKFHPLTVVRVLLEKVRREAKTRRSLVTQFTSMLNPAFTRQFTHDLLDHVFRESY